MTRHSFLPSARTLIRHLALVASAALPLMLAPTPAPAYSYATARAEPFLEGREALFQAAESGFWMAAKIAYKSMEPEVVYLDENEAPGLKAEFDTAMAAKDPAALRQVFNHAASVEIIRRLAAANENIATYDTAKLMVVAANNFFTAVAGDLDPSIREEISQQMVVALDAIGNPGVLGVGRRDADPAALAGAHAAIAAALDLAAK